MFDKSTLFNRNEPVRRRESATPVLSPPRSENGTTANDKSAIRSASSVREVSGHGTVGGTEPSYADVPAMPPAAAGERAASTPSVEADPDSGRGARLIVGPEVKLKGAEILDCDTLVVEGRVEATMDSRVIRVAENGSFIGKVSIDIAEIHGAFEGDLTARSQLIIHSTGRVKGTIRYGKLVADEGGELCGDVNVLSSGNVPRAKAVVEPIVALNAAAS